ncbi:unnamed protein product [Mytilus edulis]|uniref:Uncharacterized protein n=1 Tax=Mytilus edulis TaxID=6550 RepID=A0A8S3TK13_MYTED|nr:unnamed protein product [Mytilus edulis]
MLETQMVQNMCINTALTTQLAMQTRPTYPMSAHPTNMHCGAPPFNHFQHPVSTFSHFPPSHIPMHLSHLFKPTIINLFINFNHQLITIQMDLTQATSIWLIHQLTIWTLVVCMIGYNTTTIHNTGHLLDNFRSHTQTRQPRSHVNNSQQQSHSQSSQKKPSHLPTNSHIMDSHSQHKRTDHQTNQVRHNAHQKSEKLCATKQFPPRDRCHDTSEPISNFKAPRGQAGVSILWPKQWSSKIKKLEEVSLFRPDIGNQPTFFHHAHHGSSQIDYILSNRNNLSKKYSILDKSYANTSAHCAVILQTNISIPLLVRNTSQKKITKTKVLWEQRDEEKYRETILNELLQKDLPTLEIDQQIDIISNSLLNAQQQSIPSKITQLKGPKWKAIPEVTVLLIMCKVLYNKWADLGKPIGHPLSLELKTHK